MDISVVIPLLNEEESLQELHDWIAKVMQSNRFIYEIIFIFPVFFPKYLFLYES